MFEILRVTYLYFSLVHLIDPDIQPHSASSTRAPSSLPLFISHPPPAPPRPRRPSPHLPQPLPTPSLREHCTTPPHRRQQHTRGLAQPGLAGVGSQGGQDNPRTFLLTLVNMSLRRTLFPSLHIPDIVLNLNFSFFHSSL